MSQEKYVIPDKTYEETKSNWVSIRENNKIVKTKDNPLVGQLLKYEYVEADNPEFGDEDGMKHLLTWKVRENGELVTKKQSSISDSLINQLARGERNGYRYFKVWGYMRGGKMFYGVEPLEGKKDEDDEVPGTDDVGEVVDEMAEEMEDEVPPPEPANDEDVKTEDIPF